MELDKTFCNNSENINNDNGNISCYTKIIGFSEGSINVKFEIIRIVLMDAMPSADEIFTEMEEIIVSNGIGNFEVDETSFELRKYITLVYRIDVQDEINVQVGKFLKNIKRAGQNRRAGGIFFSKSINVQTKIRPCRGDFFSKALPKHSQWKQ